MNKDEIDKHYDKWRLIILAVAAFLVVLIYTGNTFYQNQKTQRDEPKYRMIIQFNDGRTAIVYEKDKETLTEDYYSLDSGIRGYTEESR